jgi:hypothetical protein
MTILIRHVFEDDKKQANRYRLDNQYRDGKVGQRVKRGARTLTVRRSKELSLLSKNSLSPTLWTTTSQPYTDRGAHMSVAKMASVAKTVPASSFASRL